MLMADTMAVFFVVLGLTLAFVSLALLARGLWPNAVRVSTERTRRGLVLPFVVGFPVALVPIASSIALAKLGGPIGTIIGATVLSATVFHSFIGVAGLATCIGERLASASDAHRPWRATLRGGVVLALSGLLPIVGWFVLLPVAFVIGAGAATIALIRRLIPAEPSPDSNSTELGFPTVTAEPARQ